MANVDVNRRGERGMVTAELATIAPFAVALAFLLLWVVTLGLTQVRLADAAREGARLVARGETTATATRAAQRLAPEGAHVAIEIEQGVVVVRVDVRSGIDLPGLADLGSRRLSAASTAVLEAGS